MIRYFNSFIEWLIYGFRRKEVVKSYEINISSRNVQLLIYEAVSSDHAASIVKDELRKYLYMLIQDRHKTCEFADEFDISVDSIKEIEIVD